MSSPIESQLLAYALHNHEMIHALAQTQRSQGDLLGRIAHAVAKLSPAVDQELVLAIGESKAKHDALKMALDSQAASPPVS